MTVHDFKEKIVYLKQQGITNKIGPFSVEIKRSHLHNKKEGASFIKCNSIGLNRGDTLIETDTNRIHFINGHGNGQYQAQYKDSNLAFMQTIKEHDVHFMGKDIFSFVLDELNKISSSYNGIIYSYENCFHDQDPHPLAIQLSSKDVSINEEDIKHILMLFFDHILMVMNTFKEAMNETQPFKIEDKHQLELLTGQEKDDFLKRQQLHINLSDYAAEVQSRKMRLLNLKFMVYTPQDKVPRIYKIDDIVDELRCNLLKNLIEELSDLYLIIK